VPLNVYVGESVPMDIEGVMLPDLELVSSRVNCSVGVPRENVWEFDPDPLLVTSLEGVSDFVCCVSEGVFVPAPTASAICEEVASIRKRVVAKRARTA